MKVLKEKLGDAGPEVVARMSGEREKVESRLRSANRTVLELESAVAELQGKLRQSEEDSIKVMETCRTYNNVSKYAVFHVKLKVHVGVCTTNIFSACLKLNRPREPSQVRQVCLFELTLKFRLGNFIVFSAGGGDGVPLT